MNSYQHFLSYIPMNICVSKMAGDLLGTTFTHTIKEEEENDDLNYQNI
jgi:hypothetical protein